MLKSKAKKTIGITIGDPAGIGPEVTVKAIQGLSKSLADFILIGDNAIFEHYARRIPDHIHLIDLKNPFAQHILPGKPSRLSAQAALSYLNCAVKLLKEQKLDSLVTAPVSKEHISDLGIPFEGHTEYLAHAFKIKTPGMLFVAPHMRIIIVTRHIPLNKVAQRISKRSVFETIELTHNALKKLFKVRYPRIGICGLNPHAGEGGQMGKEEIHKITPAIFMAQKHGIKASGPFAADTLFAKNHYRQFDAIVAMYHDQGLIPIKTLFFNELVNLTIGLPFIRTSPAHGTAFDIAGKDQADHRSMIAAVKLAVEIA